VGRDFFTYLIANRVQFNIPAEVVNELLLFKSEWNQKFAVAEAPETRSKAAIREKNQLLTIMPRYSPASAVVDNKLYIFGGRGSETGKQEVNPQFKYDMYAVDLKSEETQLLWETQEDPQYLPCGNMIYNPIDSCFYVLTNIENGMLIRITTRNSRIERASNGIQQSLTADFLFYNLYLSEKQQKLYALFCSNLKQGMSVLSFYEINFPPLSQSEISQSQNVREENSRPFILAGILSAALLAIALLFFTCRKRKKSGMEKVAITSKRRKANRSQGKRSAGRAGKNAGTH
jgi:hypothetical protein